MSTEIQKRESAEAQVAPADLLSAIARAASDPNVDVEKMERLYAMHKDLMAEQRRASFDAALARVQNQIPQFSKTSNSKNSMYAPLEDIDRITKPLLTAEGFSRTCSEESSTETKATFVLTLSREGHEKSVRGTFSIDRAAQNREGKSIRPAIQDDGSTMHYATRYLLKMMLGIVEKGADTDGEKREPITQEQALDIQAAIEELKMDKGRFLVFMGVGSVQDILAKDHAKAINAIDTKRRSQK